MEGAAVAEAEAEAEAAEADAAGRKQAPASNPVLGSMTAPRNSHSANSLRRRSLRKLILASKFDIRRNREK